MAGRVLAPIMRKQTKVRFLPTQHLTYNTAGIRLVMEGGDVFCHSSLPNKGDSCLQITQESLADGLMSQSARGADARKSERFQLRGVVAH